MIKEPISIKKLRDNLKSIEGLTISKAWKGYGSTLFLELGELHDELAWKKGRELTTSEAGEFTLSSAGSWRLIKGSKGSQFEAEKASSADIKKIIKELESIAIQSIKVNGKLIVKLSNNYSLEFDKSEYGFFTLVSNKKPFISYENKSLYSHHAI